MSDQEKNTERRIIEIPSSALLIRDERDRSPILSEMVSSMLVVAAEGGLANLSPDELVRLGKKLLHKDGPGNTASNIKAFGFFYQAAQTEHPEAEWLVYCCIREGDGVAHDYETMIQWLKKACQSGWHEAEYREAIAHFFGEYGKPNLDKTVNLLEASSKKGNLDALAALGIIRIKLHYNSTKGTYNILSKRVRNRLLANIIISENEVAYFKNEVLKNNVEAKFALARIYDERLNFSSDEEKNVYKNKSLNLLIESASAGFIAACLIYFQKIERPYQEQPPNNLFEILKEITITGTNEEIIDACYILELAYRRGEFALEVKESESLKYTQRLATLGDINGLIGISTLQKGANKGEIKKIKSAQLKSINLGLDKLKKAASKSSKIAVSFLANYYKDNFSSEEEKQLSIRYHIINNDDAALIDIGTEEFHLLEEETENSSEYNCYFYLKIACLLHKENLHLNIPSIIDMNYVDISSVCAVGEPTVFVEISKVLSQINEETKALADRNIDILFRGIGLN